MENEITTVHNTSWHFAIEGTEHFTTILSKYPEIEKRLSYVKECLDKSTFRDIVQLGIIVKFEKAWFVPIIDGSKKAENRIHAYSGLFKELKNKIKGTILVSTTERKT